MRLILSLLQSGDNDSSWGFNVDNVAYRDQRVSSYFGCSLFYGRDDVVYDAYMLETILATSKTGRSMFPAERFLQHLYSKHCRGKISEEDNDEEEEEEEVDESCKRLPLVMVFLTSPTSTGVYGGKKGAVKNCFECIHGRNPDFAKGPCCGGGTVIKITRKKKENNNNTLTFLFSSSSYFTSIFTRAVRKRPQSIIHRMIFD